MKKISAGSAEHYIWGTACDGWHLVKQPGLGVIQERMPPGAAEVRHLHREARQFFFVLAGSAFLEADGADFVLERGEGVEVAPGVPHRITNRGTVDLEFLIVSQPHSHGDRELA